MKIVLLVCSLFAAMVSVTQAQPTITKQSEPMRLTQQQMNTITAGARGVQVISHAFGLGSSYSRSTSLLIINRDGIFIKGRGTAAACCGAGTSAHVVIIPYIKKLGHYGYIMANNYPSFADGYHHRYFYVH